MSRGRDRSRGRGASPIAGLPSFDFTSLTPGAVSLPPGLTLTRASGASVQTGTSALVTGLGVDVARAGRRLDSDSVGLVIEESRTNLVSTARAMTGTGWTAGAGTPTTGQPSPDGTSNATRQQTTSGQFCAYFTRVVADGAVQISAWAKATSVGFASTTQFGLVNTNFSLTTAWQRVSAAFSAAGTYFITAQNAGGVVSQDASWDLFQIEQGLFATEWIPQGSTRAGDRLQCTKRLDSGGRLSLEIVCRPKGARSAYGTAHLVYVDASNRVTIDGSTGIVTCVIGGASYSTPLGADWAAHDTLRFWTEIGGSVASMVAYQIGATEPVLLSTDESPTALGAWTASTCDLLNGGGSNQFSCWLESITAYSGNGDWVS